MKMLAIVVLACFVVKAAEPISVCDISGNETEFLKMKLKIRGKLTRMQHGVFLGPAEPCDGSAGVTLENLTSGQLTKYFEAGGRKGEGVLATVEGRLVMSEVNRPRSKPHIVFSVASIRFERAR